MARAALALVAMFALAIPGCIQVDLPDATPADRGAADADADDGPRTTTTRSKSATGTSSRPASGPGPAAGPGTTTVPENGSEPLAPAPGSRRTVVVAQFDTGTNPFHPCMRRPGHGIASPPVDALPATTQELRLAFQDDYQGSLDASKAALGEVS